MAAESSDFPSDWSVLRTKRVDLLKTMAPEQLVQCMYQDKLLTMEELQDIEAEKTSHRKNTQILNILMKKDVKSGFKAFRKCLCDTEQPHVAKLLDDPETTTVSKKEGPTGSKCGSVKRRIRETTSSSGKRKRVQNTAGY